MQQPPIPNMTDAKRLYLTLARTLDQVLHPFNLPVDPATNGDLFSEDILEEIRKSFETALEAADMVLGRLQRLDGVNAAGDRRP